jgi:hypothetical protein
MQEVRFPEYRAYEAARVDSSNAMMALLAGAGLASHLLQLTQGSSHLLPEVFPRVPHIGRFNLESEAARVILDSADAHLGAMSVPYALALHEDFLRTCLSMLQRAGIASRSQVEVSLAGQHSLIEKLTGDTFDSDSLIQLDVLRSMRNCLIHGGGLVGSALISALQPWTKRAEAGWVKLAPSPTRVTIGQRVVFGHGEMILALAVTTKLAREANRLIQRVVPRSQWADVIVADYRIETDGNILAPDFLRKIRGFARFNYVSLAMTDAELREAIDRSRLQEK